MLQFAYQATLDESIALFKHVVATLSLGFIVPDRQTGALESETPAEHTELDSALEERLRSVHHAFLLPRSLRRPLKLLSFGQGAWLPDNDVIRFGLSSATVGGASDGRLQCADASEVRASSPALDVDFEDVIECAKTRLVVDTRGGFRTWVSPQVLEWAKSKTYRVQYHSWPRRLLWIPGGPAPTAQLSRYTRIAFEPMGPAGEAVAIKDRGDRPAAKVVCQKQGSVWVATSSGGGNEEVFTQLLEVCADAARIAGARIAGEDDRCRYILGEERFASIRAPRAPRTEATRAVTVDARLSRFCRDIDLGGGAEVDSPFGHARGSGDTISVDWWPEGRAHYGLERVVLWRFQASPGEVRAIGKREKPEISVQEIIWEADEACVPFEVERVLAPAVADGAIQFRMPAAWQQGRTAIVAELAPLFRTMVGASGEARSEAVRSIVDAIDAMKITAFLRRDEVHAAIEARALAPDVEARTSKIPDRPSALARSPGLAAVVAALRRPSSEAEIRIERTSLGASLATIVTRAGQVLEMVDGTAACASHDVEDVEPLFGLALDEVLPFVRDPEVPLEGGVLVEVRAGEASVRAYVPREATLRVSRLVAFFDLAAKLGRASAPSKEACRSLRRIAEGAVGRWWIRCTSATDATTSASVVVHSTGAVWREFASAGNEQRYICEALEPTWARRFASQLLDVGFPGPMRDAAKVDRAKFPRSEIEIVFDGVGTSRSTLAVVEPLFSGAPALGALFQRFDRSAIRRGRYA